MKRRRELLLRKSTAQTYAQGWWQFSIQCVLAVATVLAVWLAFDSSRQALLESRRALDEQLRPFLKISYVERRPIFELICPQEYADRLVANEPASSFDTADFKYLKEIVFRFERRLRYSNLGKRPLRIARIAAGSLYEREWDSVFQKDALKLVGHLKSLNLLSEQDVDLTVLPSDSIEGTSVLGNLATSIPSQDLVESLSGPISLVIYFWEYIEYEDFSNNTYNLFSMYNGRITLKPKDSKVNIGSYFVPSTERQRYDITETTHE